MSNNTEYDTYPSRPSNTEYSLIPTLQVILANTGDPQASHLASKLSETGAKVVPNVTIQTNNWPPSTSGLSLMDHLFCR